jgi:tetratricopeptide (TPR) repeat protein
MKKMMNRSGADGLIGSNKPGQIMRRLPMTLKQHLLPGSAALVLAMLAACAGPAPVPQGPATPAPPEKQETPAEVQKQVREPARRDSAGVQVHPLQNPAVKALLADAAKAEAQGDYDAAASSLERAMRIQPKDPEVLQAMAEIQLHKQDYQQALNFATRSYDDGARVGEICSRNWRTISVARGHLGDKDGATEAELRARQCMNTKPASY